MADVARQLKRLIDVRAGEGREVALAFATLFSFMAGHGILEPARDALFLSRLPPERLPWVYIAMAVVGIGAVRLKARIPSPRGSRALNVTFGLVAVVTTLFALTIARTSLAAAPYVVYVWVGLAASASTVALWQTLGDRFTVAQAKRLFGPIGAGGVIGVATGSGLAAALSGRLAPASLLVAGAAFYALAAAIPLAMARVDADGAGATRETSDPLYAFRVVRKESHARRLLYLVAITTMTLTMLDFLFKSRVSATIPHARLGVFFGEYYAAVNAVALVVQVFATPWILRKLGTTGGLSILPALVLSGALAFAGLPILAIVLMTRAAEGALRFTVQETSLEVLFLPLPDSARRALKGLIEFVGQRGAQAVASAGILVAVALGAGPRVIAAAVAILAALWLLGLRGIERGYLDLFRRQLRTGTFDASTHLPPLDLPTVELLLVSLSSAEEREAIAALELLEQQGKLHLVPSLIVYHPARAVALRALDVFARHGRMDALPLLGALIAYGDPQRRAAALRLRQALAPELGALDTLTDASDPATAAAVFVARAARQADPRAAVEEACRIAHGHDATSRIELARAIAADAHPRWIPALVALGACQDTDVLHAVAEAARKLKRVELVPALVAMLATRAHRDAAREALAAMGDGALPDLARALEDASTSIAIRRHIPRSLVPFDGAVTARTLLARLVDEPDGMTRYKILRALGRMRALDAGLTLDAEALLAMTTRTLDRMVELLWFGVSVTQRTPEASAERDLLLELLVEKQRRATERLFRLLDLLDSEQDYRLIYEGIRKKDPKARAAGREILSNAISAELRETTLVLLDDLGDHEKVDRLRAGRPELDRPASVERMAGDRSGAVRQLVEHYRTTLKSNAAEGERLHEVA